MALTEQQFDAWWKSEGIEQATYAEKSAARKGWYAAIAALPKPDPVAWALDCQSMGGGISSVLSWSKSGAGACKRLQGEAHEKPLYDFPPIDNDLLTIHRILQCVADCPPVEMGDSKVLRDFKSYCITMNGIAERAREQLAESQAREVKLREAVEKWCKFDSLNMPLDEWFKFCEWYKAFPSNDSALREALEGERIKYQAEIQRLTTLANTAEKWRGIAMSLDGNGRTVQEVWAEGAANEREVCAKMVEQWFNTNPDDCAAAIRARADKEQ